MFKLHNQVEFNASNEWSFIATAIKRMHYSFYGAGLWGRIVDFSYDTRADVIVLLPNYNFGKKILRKD